MAMTWGFGASQDARAFLTPGDDTCAMADDKLVTRLVRMAQGTWESTFRAVWYDPDNARDPTQTRCVYADTITAAQVFSENPEIGERVGALLKDRIVLIGASHSFTPDRHVIPHVGSIPGVFVHAMAADNLITDQANYSRPAPGLLLALDWSDFVEILLTAALILLMWNASVMAAQAGADNTTRFRILSGTALFGLLVVIAVLLVERLALHWPAPNVIGVAALAASLFLLLEQHSRNEETKATKT
jgi:CHASE2 domain-containing sensor protein